MVVLVHGNVVGFLPFCSSSSSFADPGRVSLRPVNNLWVLLSGVSCVLGIHGDEVVRFFGQRTEIWWRRHVLARPEWHSNSFLMFLCSSSFVLLQPKRLTLDADKAFARYPSQRGEVKSCSHSGPVSWTCLPKKTDADRDCMLLSPRGFNKEHFPKIRTISEKLLPFRTGVLWICRLYALAH